MSKFELKPEVIKLRKSGKSIFDISKAMRISKSTASIWCRNIVMTVSQRNNLIDRMIKSGHAGRIKGAEANRNKKYIVQEEAKVWANKTVSQISLRDRLIAGLALYWAEGSKADSTFGFVFVNSDPVMVRFMLDWLVEIMDVPKEQITAAVSINMMHKSRDKEVLNFWSHLLDLPLSSFSKTFFASSVRRKIYANHSRHFGVLRLSVRKSSRLKYKVIEMINVLKAGVAQVVRANAS